MASITSTDLAIDLRNVSKIYKKKVHALQGISMQVRRGEIFGLLGPNGAGKSTLVKIMMTVLRPTRAEGTVLGHKIGHKPTLARVGYLPENHRFPKYLTGRQTLEFFGAMGDVNRLAAKRRAGELLETVGMKDWGDAKISTYSKGMLQRIGVAQALMNDPDLVLLDEPTDGVDPVGRRDIREVLMRLREQGKSVLVNSHLLSELEVVCDRVAILVRGQVAQQGTIEELTRAQQRYEIELAVPNPLASRRQLLEILRATNAVIDEKIPSLPPSLPAGSTPYPANPPNASYPGTPAAVPSAKFALDAGHLPENVWIELQGALIRVGTADPIVIQPLIDSLRGGGFLIRRVTPVRQTLEDLFMQAVIDPSSGTAMAPGAEGGPGHRQSKFGDMPQSSGGTK